MTAPTYRDYVYTPSPRREHLGRWAWYVGDGMTGPTLCSGTTLTCWGAYRRMVRASLRCRSINEVLAEIVERLHADGIDVEARLDEQLRVCVRPSCPCSDRDHRRVVREFYALVGPVRWGVA